MKTRTMQIGLAIAAIGLYTQPLTALAEQGDWIFRGGIGVVDPSSDNLTIAQDGPDAELQVDTGTSLTGEVTYMATRHIGVELLASWPFSHDIESEGPPGGLSGEIGSIKHLPPTLSLQYHFNPDGRFRPYVGAGLNYTIIFDEQTTGDLAGTDLDLDNSFGLAGQAGVDIGLNENVFVNLAVRYIDIDSDASVDGTDIGTVEIDPWIYQAQMGYRFGKRAVPMAAAAAAPVAAAAPRPTAPPPPPPRAAADSDGDGVPDSLDQCPDTPKGERVGPQGCTCDVTRQLQFAFNSAELSAEDKVILDEVVENLKRLKFIEGTVIGHTDSTGPEAFNQGLSERRAATVARYLEDRGIAPGRLKVKGLGEGQPIADNKTAEGRRLNRRVVLQRTDCDQP
jgi:outer membrane protein